MPHGTTTISRTDPEFNNYIRTSKTHLLITPPPPGNVPHYERLGLTDAQKDAWVVFHNNWVTTYDLWSNKATRTSTLTKEKNKIKKDFIAFAEQPLLTISGSENITLEDREALNLPERDRQPTARASIETAPFVNINVLSGTRLKITCRVEEDSTRASRHPAADQIEMRYQIGGTPPANAGVAPLVETFTRSISNLQLPLEKAGQRIWCFLRWKNSSDKTKSGPWSHSETAILTD